MEPASHGSNDPGNDSNTELSKEDIKGHKEELKHMQVSISQFTCSVVTSFSTKLVEQYGMHVLQNQAAKYDPVSNAPDKNGPVQSMGDMNTQRKQ